MKYFIFLLFPCFITAQVNFSTYGATNNGTTDDDTAELQSALDSEADLIADAGATFFISSTLNIDTQSGQTIDWNGATIITNSYILMMDIDKRTANAGGTTMINLTLDGNNLAHYGILAESSINLNNVDITGMIQADIPDEPSPYGIKMNFNNDSDAQGNWILDGCDINDIVGTNDGNIGDSLGAANGVLVYWNYVPSVTTILTVKNASIHDCWGEDSQGVATFSSGIDISDGQGSMVFENLNIYNWERRSVKAFAGNQTWTNCTFTDPDPSNPNLSVSPTQVGLVVIGSGSGSTGANNFVFEGCTFTRGGYDGRVIVEDTDNVQFNNCEWVGGADLRFTSFTTLSVGVVYVCNSIFSTGSVIDSYGNIDWDAPDSVFLDTDNTYTDGFATTVDLSSANYEVTDLSCPPLITGSPGSGGGSSTPNKLKNETSGMLISH